MKKHCMARTTNIAHRELFHDVQRPAEAGSCLGVPVWLAALPLYVVVALFGLVSAATAGEITVERLPRQQERIQPVVMKEKAPDVYFIDFGKARFAGLELSIEKAEAGRTLVVRMGEAISAPETVDRKPGGCVRFHSTEITLEAGRDHYVVPLRGGDRRLMPRELGPAMPFRYVEIENAPRLTKQDVTQVATFYPFNDAAADFKCSNPDLNAIWALCKHTMKATSFGGVFIDGDRERKPYEADAYINQLGWYCCTDDLTLPRYTHEYLILRPTWPTEWILISTLMAWEDYRYTGDTTSLEAFYDDLKAKTLIALQREDGLISTREPPMPKEVIRSIHRGSGTGDIVDWPRGERDGYDMKPVNTVVNAFHCRSLEVMAEMAAAIGKQDDAKRFKNAADKVRRSINEKLFDKETGLYVDGEGSKHSALHANMFPLAFGLVPADRRDKVAAFVKSRGMACSVYGAQFLMEALFDQGLADYAMALMTADNDRSWKHMIDVGATMTMEAWDRKYKGNLDWNHAWGAAPANILPRKVLGIEPLEPGFAKILIQPRPGTLTWAEGHVPSKAGRIAVRFDQDASSFHLKVDIPNGTTARVGVPKGAGGSLSLDGKPVKATESGGHLFVDPVPAGKHELRLSR